MNKTILVIGVILGVAVGYWLFWRGGATLIVTAVPQLATIKNYLGTTFNNFVENAKQNPIPTLITVGGAASLVGGLAYKAINTVKQHATEAVSTAQQSETTAYQVAGQIQQRNVELEKQLTTVPDVNAEIQKATNTLTTNLEEAQKLVSNQQQIINDQQKQIADLTGQIQGMKTQINYVDRLK